MAARAKNRNVKVGVLFADQSQRPDFLLEVLGFEPPRDRFLASEQKRRDGEIMLVKLWRLQRQGLTKQQAADQISDPCGCR